MPTWAKAVILAYVFAVLSGVVIGTLLPDSGYWAAVIAGLAIVLIVTRICGWPCNRTITQRRFK